MALTKLQKQIRIRLMLRAKVLLKQGKADVVCLAIHGASNSMLNNLSANMGPKIIREREHMLSAIGISLQECAFVDTWLNVYHNVSEDLLTDANMLDYRLRWLDHMIQEVKDAEESKEI